MSPPPRYLSANIFLYADIYFWIQPILNKLFPISVGKSGNLLTTFPPFSWNVVLTCEHVWFDATRPHQINYLGLSTFSYRYFHNNSIQCIHYINISCWSYWMTKIRTVDISMHGFPFILFLFSSSFLSLIFFDILFHFQYGWKDHYTAMWHSTASKCDSG